MSDLREPPEHLGQAAKAWFRQIVREFDFETEAEWKLLEEAAGCVDRLEQCRRAIRRHGLLVKGGSGGLKPNPATVIERDCRVLLCRITRELRLGEPAQEDPRIPRIASTPQKRKGA